MYRIFFKRALDILISFAALIVISPVIIVLLIILLFVNKGWMFFTQLRPGENERLFRIIKFKTMTDAHDADGILLPDAQRLTKIGKLIRKHSLDEIPQLFNVLIGNMSLVGPRPLLPEYLFLYTDDQRLRHLVKPGITGWAQVNGRNTISWEQKFNFDVYYIRHLSFSLDMKIIFLTLLKVMKREGINQPTHVTSQKFTGN